MALLVGILLAAAVLLAVGLVAAGRIDGMSRAVPDSPPGIPPGPLSPEALRTVTLPVVLRGYRMADVDALLERAAAEIEARSAAPAGHPRPRPTPSLSKRPTERADGAPADGPQGSR